MRVSGVVAALFALTSCAGLPGIVQASPEQLLISGCSVSNVGYLADLAADYQKISGVKVFVRGGGTVIGIEDLLAGTTDLAASCRGCLPGDPGDIEYIPVAWDALVFVVHPTNPATSLSLAEAEAVMQGRIADWSLLRGPAGPIAVFLQRPAKGTSGVESTIRNQVLRDGSPPAGSNITELASSGIVEQLVEKTPGSFGASGFSSARKRAVKMLALDGVTPTKQTIIDRTYPLRRPLYLIVKKPVSPGVRAFLDFALDRQGQDLISSYGAISLREMK